jgi:hypothetical protein
MNSGSRDAWESASINSGVFSTAPGRSETSGIRVRASRRLRERTFAVRIAERSYRPKSVICLSV